MRETWEGEWERFRTTRWEGMRAREGLAATRAERARGTRVLTAVSGK